MKLISDSGCFRCCTKSTQLMYGFMFGVADIVVDGGGVEFTPRLVQRRDPGVATAREVEHREIERQPNRLLRSASVTNSSISLPTVRVTPRTMAPTACSGVGPLAAKASGLRKAAMSPNC